MIVVGLQQMAKECMPMSLQQCSDSRPRHREPLPISLGVGVVLLTLFVGCGGGEPPAVPQAESPARSDSPTVPVVPPVASIELRSQTEQAPQTTRAAEKSSEDDDFSFEEDSTTDASSTVPEPEKGSPEWLIREITRLRTASANPARQPSAGNQTSGETVESTSEQAEAERLRRQVKIIDLATQAIARTHQDQDREQVFNNAVHYLADARMQLALAGDDEQAQLLKEDAEALFKRDPTSFAAVESSFKILQFLQLQAQKQAADDSKWATAFARQARLFAERFPQESARGAIHLLAAGRACDHLGIESEAKSCMEVIEQRFPESPFAEQAAGTLRRLRLPGQRLHEFGGSTHDGGFVSIEQYRGRTLLIAFWASNSANFAQDLPVIQQTLRKYPDRVTAVGVNLDRDELAVDRFLESSRLDWKHIFYSDPEKRGARNLVARHYGVNKVPTYWLVDPQGTVVSINVDVARLDQAIAETLK